MTRLWIEVEVHQSGTQPVAKQKYSGFGGFSAQGFIKLGVPVYLAKGLKTTGNFGLSQGWWKTYRTVDLDRHLITCSKETFRCLEFPLSPADVLTFIAWLINRGLRANTVQAYLSGLRMTHITSRLSPLKVSEKGTGLLTKLDGSALKAQIWTIHRTLR